GEQERTFGHGFPRTVDRKAQASVWPRLPQALTSQASGCARCFGAVRGRCREVACFSPGDPGGRVSRQRGGRGGGGRASGSTSRRSASTRPRPASHAHATSASRSKYAAAEPSRKV